MQANAPGGAEYMAAMGVGGKEMATVRIEPSGYVTAFTAQAPHGQSHETTLAQVVASELGVPFENVKVVASELGVPFENVKVVHGDTQIAPFSMIGTGGSSAALQRNRKFDSYPFTGVSPITLASWLQENFDTRAFHRQ